MKKDFSLFLGLVFFTIWICGCSTEYNLVTQEEEFIYYSTEREVKLGESIAKQIQEEYDFIEDPLIQNRVEEIGKKIVAVCDRKDVNYHFYVLDEEEDNAFSLPGGFIYIDKELIDKISSDDELAAILAHEIGHVVARHSVKKLQAVMGYSFLRVLIAVAPVEGSGSATRGADLAFAEILTGYAREDEMLADQLATRYIKRAGYDPYAMLSVLEKLQDINRKRPLQPISYYKTHPYVPDRIRVVKQELGEPITFDDYINIQDLPHGQ